MECTTLWSSAGVDVERGEGGTALGAREEEEGRGRW